MFFPAKCRQECQQKFTCRPRQNMISSTRPACLGNSYSFGQQDPGQKPAKVYQISQRNMIAPASPPGNSDPPDGETPGERQPNFTQVLGETSRVLARLPATYCLPACPGNLDSLRQRDPGRTPKKFTRSHGCNQSILTSDPAGRPIQCLVRSILTDRAGQPVL